MQFLSSRMRMVDQLAFGHDGRKLYAAGTNVPMLIHKPGNRGIDVWDLPADSRPAGGLFEDKVVTGFAINPAGRWLYVGTGYEFAQAVPAPAYWAVELATGLIAGLGPKSGNWFSVAVHPSGEWLVGFGSRATWRDRRIIRWRQPPEAAPVEEWGLVPTPDHTFVHRIACDPAADRVITHEFQTGIAVTDLVFELLVRDADGGEVLDRIPIPGRTVDQVAFSPDGAHLVVRGGPSLLVWDARDLARKPRKVSGGEKRHLTGLAFHPSGRYLAVTGNDRSVKLIDTETWVVARAYSWDIGRMRSIAFSPDGTLAAAGSDTGQVVLWDVDL